MINMIGVTMLSFSILSALSSNPMMVSVMILMYSSLMFLLMSIKQGNMWFPTIFFMLFVGGILITFMILSSVMPNEKLNKKSNMKMMFWTTSIMIVLFLSSNKELSWFSELNQKMKWFMESTSSMTMSTSMIILYFFYFIALLSMQKSSLRSTSCYTEKIL